MVKVFCFTMYHPDQTGFRETFDFMIISDSKTFIRNFSVGRVKETGLSIFIKHPPTQDIALMWTPAHAGLSDNEAAHTCV